MLSGTEATPNGSAAYADLDDQLKINRAPPKLVPDETPAAVVVKPPVAEPVEPQPKMEEEAMEEDGGDRVSDAEDQLFDPKTHMQWIYRMSGARKKNVSLSFLCVLISFFLVYLTVRT